MIENILKELNAENESRHGPHGPLRFKFVGACRQLNARRRRRCAEAALHCGWLLRLRLATDPACASSLCAVLCELQQNSGAGLANACTCYWDSSTDGTPPPSRDALCGSAQVAQAREAHHRPLRRCFRPPRLQVLYGAHPGVCDGLWRAGLSRVGEAGFGAWSEAWQARHGGCREQRASEWRQQRASEWRQARTASADRPLVCVHVWLGRRLVTGTARVDE